MAKNTFEQVKLTPRATAISMSLTDQACKDSDIRAALLHSAAHVIAAAKMDRRLDIDLDQVFADLRGVTERVMFLNTPTRGAA